MRALTTIWIAVLSWTLSVVWLISQLSHDAKVRQSGLCQQEYLLRAALETPILVVEDLKPLLGELRAWGRNLNQLTVLAHQGHIQSADLSEATAALGRVYEAVNRLLTVEGRVVSHGDVQLHP